MISYKSVACFSEAGCFATKLDQLGHSQLENRKSLKQICYINNTK